MASTSDQKWRNSVNREVAIVGRDNIRTMDEYSLGLRQDDTNEGTDEWRMMIRGSRETAGFE